MLAQGQGTLLNQARLAAGLGVSAPARSTAPTLSRGFFIACETTQVSQRFLVHGGSEKWHTPDGVSAIGLTDLMRHLAP